MSDDARLKLAEAYYLVARDLEWHAQEFTRVADLLNIRADTICEQKISDEAKAERAAVTSSAPTKEQP
jgi:hypothetical protein